MNGGRMNEPIKKRADPCPLKPTTYTPAPSGGGWHERCLYTSGAQGEVAAHSKARAARAVRSPHEGGRMRSAAESACHRLFSFPRRGQPLCDGPGTAQLSAHRAASAPPPHSVPDKQPSTLESQRVLRFQSVSHLSHQLIGTPHARRLHERARFKASSIERGRQEMSAFCVYAAASEKYRTKTIDGLVKTLKIQHFAHESTDR